MRKTTRERKNRKRLARLGAMKDPDRDAELKRLFAEWVREARRRAKSLALPPAGDLIDVAARYDLGAEVACAVIKAVESELGGPRFASRSVRLPNKNVHPDAVAGTRERFAL